MANPKLKYYLLLHFTILIWGFTGILGKLIHQDPFLIVWYRILFAVIGLGIGLLFFQKSLQLKSFKEFLLIATTGIIVALHWITFYKSIELSTASLGILCLSTTTLHVTWIEPIITGRRFSFIEFILSLLVIYGIYFVSDDFTTKEYEALVYGLFSAFFAALFAVLNSKLSQKTEPHKISFYELLSALFVLSIVLLFCGDYTETLFVLSQSDFLWLVFLGVVCTSFAFPASVEAVKRLGAFTVSLSINLEPVYTILLAIFILQENEILGYQFYIGAGVIVLVVVFNALLKQYVNKTAGADSKDNAS